MGDPGLTPGLGRSSGEGNGNPLQYSCLENPMDREGWWATVHGITIFYIYTYIYVYIYIYYSAIKKRKILPFVTTWMKLEYHGKWNNSDRGRQALNDLRCMCPLPSPRVCSSSHPLSQWCYLTISSSAVPFFCLQSFPASGLFQRVGSLHQVAKVLTVLYCVFESCRWEVEWN